MTSAGISSDHRPTIQPFRLVVPPRPDLEKFKPPDGPQAYTPVRAATTKRTKGNHSLGASTSTRPRARKHSEDSEGDDVLLSDLSSSMISHAVPSASASTRSTKKKSSKSNTPKNIHPHHTSRGSSNKRKGGARTHSEEPDADQDDLFLSDFSEPETKFREREPEARMKFAKLRRARKQTDKNRAIKKRIFSQRIVPDSDADSNFSGQQSDSEDGCTTESDSETESETDEEERKRKEKEFIVDDMATKEQQMKVQKRMDTFMPACFRNVKQDNLSHFSVVCQYLVHRILMPHISWRARRAQFDYSCKHLDDFFQTRCLQILDSAAWIERFRSELRSRPFITVVNLRTPIRGCAACNCRARNGNSGVKLHGQTYNPVTLNPIPKQQPAERSETSDDDIDSYSDTSTLPDKPKTYMETHIKTGNDWTEFICGPDCARRAADYHYFKHWQITTLRHLKREIDALRGGKATLKIEDPKPEKEAIVKLTKEAKELYKTLEKGTMISDLFARMISRQDSAQKAYMGV